MSANGNATDMPFSEPDQSGGQSGFIGTIEQTAQDPSSAMGYQEISTDQVERISRNPVLRLFKAVPTPLLLLAGVAIPLAFILRRRR